MSGVERDITTDPANITRKVKKSNKQLYSYNFNKFDEMEQSLKQQIPQTYVYNSVTIKVIFPIKESSTQLVSLENSMNHLKNNWHQFYTISSRKIEEDETHYSLFY